MIPAFLASQRSLAPLFPAAGELVAGDPVELIGDLLHGKARGAAGLGHAGATEGLAYGALAGAAVQRIRLANELEVAHALRLGDLWAALGLAHEVGAGEPVVIVVFSHELLARAADGPGLRGASLGAADVLLAGSTEVLERHQGRRAVPRAGRAGGLGTDLTLAAVAEALFAVEVVGRADELQARGALRLRGRRALLGLAEELVAALAVPVEGLLVPKELLVRGVAYF